jgi:hypothetical protein
LISSPPRLETRISIGTTARSWAISTPTAILPGALRNSPISSSIFIATTVLDNAMMNPRISVSDGLASSMKASSAASASEASNCPPATITAGLRLRTKALIDSSMPMKNSSTTTPISASSDTFSDVEITPMPVGPSARPARMNPTSGGCLSRMKPRPRSAAIATAIAIPSMRIAVVPALSDRLLDDLFHGLLDNATNGFNRT